MLKVSLSVMILLYLGLQTLYVVLNTLKSIWQIKAGKMLASVSSGICYAVYVFVLVFTTLDFNGISYWWGVVIKAVLTFITNFIGVWVSMLFLEKIRKDKLWEITATITNPLNCLDITTVFDNSDISYNITDLSNSKGCVFHIYSKTQKESVIVKQVLDKYNAKYIVHEESVRL